MMDLDEIYLVIMALGCCGFSTNPISTADRKSILTYHMTAIDGALHPANRILCVTDDISGRVACQVEC